jgi:hypothetical protein
MGTKNLFSKDNQPKRRKKSNKMLTKALIKRLRQMPDGEEKLKFRDMVVEIIMKEFVAVYRGERPMTPALAKLIDMVFDRVDGPVKQEMEVDMNGPAVILVENNLEDALKAYEAEEPDDDEEEPAEAAPDAEPEEKQ